MWRRGKSGVGGSTESNRDRKRAREEPTLATDYRVADIKNSNNWILRNRNLNAPFRILQWRRPGNRLSHVCRNSKVGMFYSTTGCCDRDCTKTTTFFCFLRPKQSCKPYVLIKYTNMLLILLLSSRMNIPSEYETHC